MKQSTSEGAPDPLGSSKKAIDEAIAAGGLAFVALALPLAPQPGDPGPGFDIFTHGGSAQMDQDLLDHLARVMHERFAIYLAQRVLEPGAHPLTIPGQGAAQ